MKVAKLCASFVDTARHTCRDGKSGSRSASFAHQSSYTEGHSAEARASGTPCLGPVNVAIPRSSKIMILGQGDNQSVAGNVKETLAEGLDRSVETPGLGCDRKLACWEHGL